MSFKLKQYFHVKLSSMRKQIDAVFGKEGILVFLLIAFGTALVHWIAFLLPVFRCLPNPDITGSSLKALWQVHASILGITVVVVTILVTVLASDDNRTRTWKLYAKKTRFLLIVWFNLVAIISEGIASFQASRVPAPFFSSDKTGNLILTEGFLLMLSLMAAAWLFKITFNFLNEDYVEALSEKDIINAMPDALEEDLRRGKAFMQSLQGGTNGR